MTTEIEAIETLETGQRWTELKALYLVSPQHVHHHLDIVVLPHCQTDTQPAIRPANRSDHGNGFVQAHPSMPGRPCCKPQHDSKVEVTRSVKHTGKKQKKSPKSLVSLSMNHHLCSSLDPLMTVIGA